MTRIAFIGLGNMGGGMAANQAKAGHEVIAFDLSKAALDHAKEAGCSPAASTAEAVKDADVVITEREGDHGDPFWQAEFPLMASWAFRN